MRQAIKTIYRENVIPKRKEIFGVDNVHMVPAIEKVVLNVRVKKGGAADEDKAVGTITRITGQRAVKTLARQSISNFKIREGMVLGAKVTLRDEQAYSFLDRLVSVTLPRVRDFNGLPLESFDGHGNYTVGIPEHNVFPETAGDDVAGLHAVEITINTTAKNDKDALALLMALGFPFKKDKTPAADRKKSYNRHYKKGSK